jgi:hypothetical protein
MDNQSSSRKSENPASGQSSVEKEKNVFEEFGDHVEKFASRTVESNFPENGKNRKTEGGTVRDHFQRNINPGEGEEQKRINCKS